MDNADLVREFYRGIAEKDAAALDALITSTFDADARVVLPDSLPYGGTVGGAGKLARMFSRMVSSPVPVGAQNLVLVDLVDGGSRVAARIEFAWYAPGSAAGIPASALELWTFAGARVREIRAYYWDTAALLSGPTPKP